MTDQWTSVSIPEWLENVQNASGWGSPRCVGGAWQVLADALLHGLCCCCYDQGWKRRGEREKHLRSFRSQRQPGPRPRGLRRAAPGHALAHLRNPMCASCMHASKPIQQSRTRTPPALACCACLRAHTGAVVAVVAVVAARAAHQPTPLSTNPPPCRSVRDFFAKFSLPRSGTTTLSSRLKANVGGVVCGCTAARLQARTITQLPGWRTHTPRSTT